MPKLNVCGCEKVTSVLVLLWLSRAFVHAFTAELDWMKGGLCYQIGDLRFSVSEFPQSCIKAGLSFNTAA